MPANADRLHAFSRAFRIDASRAVQVFCVEDLADQLHCLSSLVLMLSSESHQAKIDTPHIINPPSDK